MITMAKRGRPRDYKSVDDMSKKIDEYFMECDKRMVDVVSKLGTVVKVNKQRPYTISGLCLYLDLSRKVLLEYQNREDREEFRNTITRAKMKIENDVSEGALDGRYDGRVAQFNLKNNFSDTWRDKKEIDVAASVTIIDDISE